MARRRLDTGNFQQQRQAVAPQPDRDFPQATKPQTTAALNTPRVIPGHFEPTGPPGVRPPTQAPGIGQGNAQGGVRPQQGYNFNQLWEMYQDRLDSGRGGQQFLQNHPRFAQNVTRNFQQAPQPSQGRPTAPMGPGTQLPQQPVYSGQYQIRPGPGNYAGVERTPDSGTPGAAAPGTVVTSAGVPVHTQPPPGSVTRPDGSIDLPTGWAGIEGPNGLVYVQGWNQLDYEAQIQLISEIKGQDWVTPAGGQLVNYGPGISAVVAPNQAPNQGAALPLGPNDVVPPAPPGFEDVPMSGYQRADTPGQPQSQAPNQPFMVNPGQGGYAPQWATGDPSAPINLNPENVVAMRGGGQIINGGVGGSLPGPGQGGGRPGGPIGEGTGNPGDGGQGGAPASPNPAPNPNPGASNLTLSPGAEQARRGLEDELAATLAEIGAARSQIPATLQLITTRLLNDQIEDLRNTDESANARGIYNSGIRSTDRGRVTQGYDRTRADLAADAARQLAELASAESGAYADFNRSWADVLLDLAAAAAEDPNFGSGSSTGSTYGNTGNSKGKGPKPKTQGKNKRNNNRGKTKRGNR